MMNRLGVSRESLEFEPHVEPQVSAGSFSKSAAGQPHAFFAPMHYEPNYAYPLIVWLHGPGDDEGQLKRIMPFVSLRNYVSAAIRGTMPFATARGNVGFTWGQLPSQLVLAEQRLFAAVDAVQSKFHVSSRRVFLAGAGAGGTMAFRLAMDHPTRFAGVLSLGGEFPVGGTPLARLSDARQVPIFLSCGRDSRQYPSSVVCENLKLLHTAGMNVTLRQYPCGHEVIPQMLEDMDRWIMELVVGGSSGSNSRMGNG